MAAEKFLTEQKKYDYLQLVVPDYNTMARGKLVTGRFKEQVARQKFDIGALTAIMGPNSELPLSSGKIVGENFPSCEMRPCLETLTPWPWVGSEGRRVGNVLCDLMMDDGTPDLISPRQLMKAQLEALKQQHGLVFKSAFEYEFGVFKTDTLEPLGGSTEACWVVRQWARSHELLCDLVDHLKVMGVELSTMTPELAPGQWELTTDPQEGVRGGDVAFYVKNAVKGFFETQGYSATFMSKPSLDKIGNGLHLNHSLWKQDGEEEESALLDTTQPDCLSATSRHWMAGLLAHSPALTALCCPTLNCYRRMFAIGTPGKINWGLENRLSLLRVRTARENVFFENRLPSGACNPYLAIAGTIAAGLDGLNRKLECPEPMEMDRELPRSLSQALDALEKDEVFCSVLGERFVKCYLACKREYEVSRFDTQVLNTEEKQIEFERKLYFENL